MNRKNLKILRDCVANLPKGSPKLDMSYFALADLGARGSVRIDNPNIIHSGITSYCFLGYALLAGLKPELGENWDMFGERIFQVEIGRTWNFLFSDAWADSIEECVARADKILKGFDPETEDWDYSDRYAISEDSS